MERVEPVPSGVIEDAVVVGCRGVDCGVVVLATRSGLGSGPSRSPLSPSLRPPYPGAPPVCICTVAVPFVEMWKGRVVGSLHE